jgi:hypothetical protein
MRSLENDAKRALVGLHLDDDHFRHIELDRLLHSLKPLLIQVILRKLDSQVIPIGQLNPHQMFILLFQSRPLHGVLVPAGLVGQLYFLLEYFEDYLGRREGLGVQAQLEDCFFVGGLCRQRAFVLAQQDWLDLLLGVDLALDFDLLYLYYQDFLE